VPANNESISLQYIKSIRLLRGSVPNQDTFLFYPIPGIKTVQIISWVYPTLEKANSPIYGSKPEKSGLTLCSQTIQPTDSNKNPILKY
jgi:hypothetical protein